MSSPARTGSFPDLAAELSDLKEAHYRQLLALSTLIELLVEKKFLSLDELRLKAAEMEDELEANL